MKNVVFSRLIPLTFVAVLVLSALMLILPKKADALTGSQFSAGRIIDDFVFNNSGSMTADDIQLFLNSKVPVCDTNGTQMRGSQTRAQYGASSGNPAPYTCLKNYQQTTPSRAAESGLCSYYPGGTKSAAQIIKEVSVACGLNPQVMLVLLQKEQSLITDDWPWQNQYTKATGFACPDTAPCDPSFAGFFYQVYNAARQFKKYARDSNQYGYKAMRNNYIQYNPSASCGGSTVYIENQATANLYIYTPYQPNTSALNNLYGSGDNCGAYGNRNFWRMFIDWFGTTYANDTAVAHPNGTVVSDGKNVYVIESGTRRHLSPAAFTSRGYVWPQVKPASTGDINLPLGTTPTVISGTLFNFNDAVYVAYDVAGTIKKQWVSLDTFNQLGYQWSQVITTGSPAEIPAETVPGFYGSLQHPNGSLVSYDGKVYMIRNNMRSYVGSLAFTSNSLQWKNVLSATAADKALTETSDLELGLGTILNSGGNIYVIDYDVNGSTKRPVGPWECYADRLHFSASDWYIVPTYMLPSRTSAVFTC